jgi:hypothetical protein
MVTRPFPASDWNPRSGDEGSQPIGSFQLGAHRRASQRRQLPEPGLNLKGIRGGREDPRRLLLGALVSFPSKIALLFRSASPHSTQSIETAGVVEERYTRQYCLPVSSCPRLPDVQMRNREGWTGTANDLCAAGRNQIIMISSLLAASIGLTLFFHPSLLHFTFPGTMMTRHVQG